MKNVKISHSMPDLPLLTLSKINNKETVSTEIQHDVIHIHIVSEIFMLTKFDPVFHHFISLGTA